MSIGLSLSTASPRLATATNFSSQISIFLRSEFSNNVLFYRQKRSEQCLCIANDREKVELGDEEGKVPAEDGRGDAKEASKRPFSSKELMEKLKKYGLAGVLSYGLLNTVYYLAAFLFVWFYLAPAPGKLGYMASVQRFVKIMATVWAGSQITKLLRAGGALALAPLVERGLTWFTAKFKFDSKGKAFAAIAGGCFGLAFILFIVLTMLWA